MVTVGEVVDELEAEGLIGRVGGSPSGLARPVTWAFVADPADPDLEGADDQVAVVDLRARDTVRAAVWTPVVAANPAAVAVRPATSDRSELESLFRAADDAGLAIIVLSTGIGCPAFVEAVCTWISRLDCAGLVARIAVSRRFDEALLSGAGLVDLIGCAAEFIEGSVVFTNPAGRVIVAGGSEPVADSVLDLSSSAGRADVAVHGWHWGTVHAEPGDGVRDVSLGAVLDRLPTAIAIAIARAAHAEAADHRISKELIVDLLAGGLDPSEIGHRLELAGLPTGEDWVYAAASVRLAPNRPERVAMGLRSRAISAILAEFVYDFVVLAALRPGVEPEEFTEVLAASTDPPAASEPHDVTPVLAVSELSSDLEDLTNLVREVRDTLDLATELGGSTMIVHTKSYAVDRLLNRIRNDPELARFTSQFLGPLQQYDERHSSQLILTLATYLEAGMSKTQAATQLGLRRPSLYRRLARIEEVVGSLEDPDTRLRLEIALKASRQLSNPSGNAQPEAWWMDIGRGPNVSRRHRPGDRTP